MLEERIKVELALSRRRNDFQDELAIGLSAVAGCIEVAGRQVVDFASWDTLGISQERTYRKVIIDAVEQSNLNARLSAIRGGRTPLHAQAERGLAAALRYEDCVLFSSRSQAILSLVTNLLSDRDVILLEEGMASGIVQDAAALAQVPIRQVPSGKVDELVKAIEGHSAGERIVWADGISLERGELPNLKDIVRVCLRTGARLIVDESHTVGLVGDSLLGSLDTVGLLGGAIATIGSLSYGLASFGGYLCSSRSVCDLIRARSKAYAREAALPCHAVAPIPTALGILKSCQELRQRMGELTQVLVRGLKDFGFLVLNPSGSTYVCIQLPRGISPKAVYERLAHAGYLIDWEWTLFRSQERKSLRFLISRFHTRQQILGVLEVFAGIAKSLRE